MILHTEKYTLTPARSELRLDVRPFEQEEADADADYWIEITLRQGRADIFGQALQEGETVVVVEMESVSVFSWEGNALVEITWCSCSKKAKSSVGRARFCRQDHRAVIVDIHRYLEEYRTLASTTTSSVSPVMMVVGAADCGKTTMIRTLMNYAMTSGRTGRHLPAVVNLDISGSTVMPGWMKVEHGDFHFGYFHGYTSVTKRNKDQFLVQCSAVAEMLRLRAESGLMGNGGVLIDTPAVVLEDVSLVRRLAWIFQTLLVVVIGSESLFQQLRNKDFNVCYVPAGWSVSRSAFRARLCQKVVQTYFYGPQLCDEEEGSGMTTVGRASNPSLLQGLKVSDFLVVRLENIQWSNGRRTVSRSLNDSDAYYPVNVNLASDVSTFPVLAALVYAPPEKSIYSIDWTTLPLAGYVQVLGVKNGEMEVLSPQPGPLPSNVMVLFTLK